MTKFKDTLAIILSQMPGFDVSNKVDKIEGKGLSTEDYTASEKEKLSGLSVITGDGSYEHPESHPASMIVEDETHRFVSDTEKLGWSAKVGDDDERLSDAREPLAHTHESSGGLTQMQIENLTI